MPVPVLLTVTEFAVKYPACYAAPLRAWDRHLRDWRLSGTLRPAVDWRVYLKKHHCGRTPISYAEYSVCRLIYLARGEDPFCNCVWGYHKPAIEGVLDGYAAGQQAHG